MTLKLDQIDFLFLPQSSDPAGLYNKKIQLTPTFDIISIRDTHRKLLVVEIITSSKLIF